MLLTVVDSAGNPSLVTIQAASLEAARRQAIAAGYEVLGENQGMTFERRRWLSSRAAIDVALFAEQLRDLLRAGLGVVEALAVLRSSSVGGKHIAALQRGIAEGRTLSHALSEDPAFPQLLVALVRASEWTSNLPQALDRYLEHDRAVKGVRHRVIATALYPIVLLIVGGGVLAFLLLYVMPRFAKVFEGMQGELPWSARLMVDWSRLLQLAGGAWGWLAIATLFVMVAMLALPSIRSGLSSRLLETGPLRHRLRVYYLSRWYRTTGMLVEGGIPLPEAATLATVVLPKGLNVAGQTTVRRLREGMSPAAAYRDAGMTTVVAEQLLRAGENTGDIATALSRIAHFHEAESTRALERAMRVFEPTVMAAIGVGVGVIVVLMYLPIFELAASIR